MSSVVISGDTSGAITLQAPAVAGTTTLNLPTVSGGTLVTSDSSGNVGIGTTTPNGKVDSSWATGFNYAATRTSSSGYNGLAFYENTTNTSYLVEFGSGAGGGQRLQMWTNTAFPIAFGTNNTERMRIDSSGNLLVGTTTSPSGTGQINCPKGVSGTPAFSAYASGSTTLSNPGVVKVAFATEEYDTNSNYDTSLSRFTPTVAGYYQVNSTVHAINNARLVAIVYKNGAQVYQGLDPSGNTLFSSTVSALVYCNGSTDYIEIWCFNSGTANTVQTGAPNTFFQAVLVRGA